MTPEEFARSFDVSRETLDRLKVYAALLQKWNPKINLIARTTVSNIWGRHMGDSAQVVRLAGNPGDHWADLGSGGGFPGVVAAVMLADSHPDTQITLVESDQRKCAFLRTVARETGVAFGVIADRIEATQPLRASTLTARALASLDSLLHMAETHLAAGGQAIFPKGANYQYELEAAQKKWSFSVEAIPSQTDTEAAILKIGDIERV